MSLNVYLTFGGDCRDAFEFYRSVFGGEFTEIQTYASAPPEMQFTDADKPRIMHVSLPVGQSVLMGSDTTEHNPEPLVHGNNFAISYGPSSKDDADRIYAALIADGGEAVMPLADQFWSGYFGICKDKFGIAWMMNFQYD